MYKEEYNCKKCGDKIVRFSHIKATIKHKLCDYCKRERNKEYKKK